MRSSAGGTGRPSREISGGSSRKMAVMVAEHEEVLGLEIPVYESPLVRCAESARDLERDLDRLPGRQSAATHPRAERLSLQELGDEIGNALVDAHVVDHEDVRMIQLPRRAGLVLEPAQAVGIGGEGQIGRASCRERG